MPSNEVDIWNQALGAAGTTSTVSSTTEESREAEVCRLWYNDVRDQVLRAAPWPSARTYKRLALLKERADNTDWAADDPAPGWKYAYSVPSDMIHPGWLSTFGRFDIGLYNGNEKAIMANTEDAILVYTMRQTVPQRWDQSLAMAIVYALAANIQMPLTGKRARVELNQTLANNLVLEARAAVQNSSEDQYESLPEWILARGYSQYNPYPRYVFPFGPLIAVAGAGVS